MAVTSTDQWWGEKLKIVQQENETLKQQLLERFKEEYEKEEEGGRAKTRLQISAGREPNPDDAPYRPAPIPNPGQKPWPGYPNPPKMLAHGEGRGPQPKYHDEYNRELPIPPWMLPFPDGKLREIPWMKEEYLKEHPELANAGDLMIQSLPRGGYYGNSHRPALQSGELTPDKLIETLKIAGPLLRGV